MTSPAPILRNIRLLFWGRALIEVKAYTAVVVLFYLHRGLSLDQVFYLSIVWSLTSLITEIPSGYLADRLGRKRTLLLGASLLILTNALAYSAYGVWAFVIIYVLVSSAFSCFSGTQEAMLYESLQEAGCANEMTTQNGRLVSANSIMKIFVPFLGALVAKDLLEWQFDILITVNLVAAIGSLVVLSFLREPKHLRQVADQEIGIFRSSIEIIRTHPWMVRLAMNRTLVFLATFVTWRLVQPHLRAHGFSIPMLGIFDASVYTLTFLGVWTIGRSVKRLGEQVMIDGSAVVLVLSILLVLFSPNQWGVFVGLMSAVIFGSVREPVFAHAINHHVASRSRATTLSNLNVLTSIFEIPCVLIAGWLSTFGIGYVLVFSLSIAVVALICFPVGSLANAPVTSTVSS